MNPAIESHIVLMENGIHASAKGELLNSSSGSQWHGFPLEVRMIPGVHDIAQICCPNPLIMTSSTIFGYTEVRSGCHRYLWDILPGRTKLVEAGFEIDRGRWRCSSGQSVLIELSMTHIASLLPERPRATLTGDLFSDRRLTALIEAMQAEVQGGCLTGRLYAEGLSIALLGFISERMSPRFIAPDTSTKAGTGQRLSSASMQRIHDYVEQNLASDLSISTLSRLVNLSPYYFARAFKATCGTSPHGFVIERRIAQAVHLLRRGDSLADIASFVGFSSQSHFSRVFREKIGITPAQFRVSTLTAPRGE
ncbi:helix-turn-helix transcriptional regulator [Paraburkholderia sp. 2C]